MMKITLFKVISIIYYYDIIGFTKWMYYDNGLDTLNLFTATLQHHSSSVYL